MGWIASKQEGKEEERERERENGGSVLLLHPMCVFMNVCLDLMDVAILRDRGEERKKIHYLFKYGNGWCYHILTVMPYCKNTPLNNICLDACKILNDLFFRRCEFAKFMNEFLLSEKRCHTYKMFLFFFHSVKLSSLTRSRNSDKKNVLSSPLPLPFVIIPQRLNLHQHLLFRKKLSC